MTFDEAAEQLRLAIPENFVSPTMHDIAVMVETQNRVLYELRNTYAPTIEMTPTEYEIFKSAKIDEDSADWLDDISWEKVDYNYPKFMQAWLHPETIKVVDNDI